MHPVSTYNGQPPSLQATDTIHKGALLHFYTFTLLHLYSLKALTQTIDIQRSSTRENVNFLNKLIYIYKDREREGGRL